MKKQKTRSVARLTSTRAASLSVGDHTDPASRGLQLRVTAAARGASTRRAWLFRYKWGGATVRLALGTFPAMGLSEARAKAEENRDLLDRGIDPRRARPQKRGAPAPAAAVRPAADAGDRYTVRAFSTDFIEKHLRARQKRPAYAERIVATEILPQWGHRDLRSITAADVVALLDGIVDRGSPVMANRSATVVSQFFRFAIHRGLLTSTPVQLLYRPGGREVSRDRTLSDAEVTALLGCLDTVMRSARNAAAVRILLLTGQRRGELVLARWADVDLVACTWQIPAENSKTGIAHVVPLTAQAVAEFRTLRRLAGRSRFVMPREDGNGPSAPLLLTRSISRCAATFQAAGVESFRLHDLRRTVRTGLAALGIAPHIAERVLNHAQGKIAGIYDRHDYIEEKREALTRWASHLDGLESAVSREAQK